MPTQSQPDFTYFTENSVDIVCRIGLDFCARYASSATRRILGLEPEDFIGVHAERFLHPDDLPVLQANVQKRLQGLEHTPTRVRVRHRNGAWVWLELLGNVVYDEQGRPLELVVTMRDISERVRLEEQLAALAMTDGLTGLANRRAFDEALDREWRRALREGSQMSLLLLDVDHFKRFNDRYGHQAGDDCLRAVAHALRSAVRDSGDVTARYGGEELAIILPGKGTEEALQVGERVRQAIATLRLTHDGNPECGGVVTTSIGVAAATACHGSATKMPEGLLRAADSALYKAKQEGRNRVASALPIGTSELVAAS